ncbi:thiopeptide-type bacteriocin biosynthesis protein [Sphingobacterium sp. UME9]|uniref:thiopeptide-type bacteriocin biosynthesis protein n=1 Tax=Sphingobacterium TaxID=28453 RepID=UPI001602AC54|nr:thiopeptide-type bacteriocin biosynthesis protein [Sphingobacterium sp. UME9]MBB1642750.1 hypothetical protein [Sphingobacterium sp. UME9]
MKLIPFDRAIIRTCQFSFQDTLESCWEALKKSIALSSPEFYKLIVDLDFCSYSAAPEPIRNTIERYFNRAKFRPVPFGTFASTSIVPLSTNINLAKGMTLNTDQVIHEFVDWKQIANLSRPKLDEIILKDKKLFANSSYYVVSDAIRFLIKIGDKFQLSEVDNLPGILSVLESLKHPTLISSLKWSLKEVFQNENDLFSIIDQLVACQLLLTEEDINIIGEDYFNRVNSKDIDKTQSYIISERKYIDGSLPDPIIKELQSYIQFIDSRGLGSIGEPNELKTFKQEFLKKFDCRDTPLMEALDPELGIGYGNFGQSSITSALVEELLVESENEEFMIDKIAKSINCGIGTDLSLVIDLEKIPFKSVERPGIMVPNSVTTVFSICDDLIVLDKIGGYSVNQLSGRFSMSGDNWQQFCRDIATVESDANTDVLFFDVAYLAEANVDNVNRRQQIYEYEVNILNYCTGNKPISLNDIYINIAGQEIILRSKSLGRRIVPRMASAYNYRRSDLPLFRFLCDMMNYGLRTDFSFNLSQYLPHRTFYPRVQYKNIVVSKARWIIEYNEIVPDGKFDTSFLLKMIKKRYVSIGDGDQTLCLDLHSVNDRKEIERQLRRRKTMVVEEAFVPKESAVKNTEGKSLISQMIVPFIHHNEVYYKTADMSGMVTNPQNIFAPGSEWLSYEIYCHPLRSNEVLINKVYGYLIKIKRMIRKWFFIRFNEHGEHLRLRLLLRSREFLGPVMTEFENLLAPYLNQGLISELLLRGYKREWERYAMAGIEKVESAFSTDSRLVLQLIRLNLTDAQKYNHCIYYFRTIGEKAGFEQSHLDKWITKIVNAFNDEFNMEPAKFKKINAYYISQKIDGNTIFGSSIEKALVSAVDCIIRALAACPERRKMALFTDFIHMHVNRLFSDNRRLHEMVFYNCLIKVLKKEMSVRSSSCAREA